MVLRAGDELVRMGVPLETLLGVLGNVSETEQVAEQFVKLFMDRVWKPFTESGRPEEELPHVREAIDRLRPMASEVVLALFQQRMTRRVERAFGRALDKGS